METIKFKKYFWEYSKIAFGTALLGASVALFIAPHNLVIGGVTGLGVILLYYSQNYFGFAVPVWLTNLAINIPLLILALKFLGVKFLAKTIFATLFLSLVLFIMDNVPLYIESDLFLGSVFGGVVSGFGLGIVFKNLSTTGGTDLIAMLIQHFKKHLQVSQTLMFIDWGIILLGFFVFGSEHTMYAIVSVFICIKAIDFVLEGLHFSKAAFIISQNPEEISNRIMKNMDRGVTGLNAKGMYTNVERNVLLCVVAKKEIAILKEIVASVDDGAFVILTDVREVLGEGFKKI